MVSAFVPIPWIPTPIDRSSLHRSCTWGSLAAFRIRVSPTARDAAITAFSVAVTDASSRKISAPRRRPSAALTRHSRPPRGQSVISAPRASSASTWVSSRLRPITSPPGGGMVTRPRRASKGPASRIEARIAHDTGPGSGSSSPSPAAQTRTVSAPTNSASASELTNQSDLRFDVADSRHVAQRHLLVGQERGSQDRQRGVLVAARFQRPRDGPAPLDHELGAGHVSGCVHWMSS